MKLWELIRKLEELEQQGKRDYDIWIIDGGVEKPICENQVSFSDQYSEIMLG